MSVSNSICTPNITLYKTYMYFASDKSSLEISDYLHGCHLHLGSDRIRSMMHANQCLVLAVDMCLFYQPVRTG